MTTAHAKSSPLTRRFPALAASLPHVTLGSWPTPLVELPALRDAISGKGAAGSIRALLLKDDASSHPVYGGNKVRKLEYLLADAVARGAKEVLTFGFRGSNHAAATAVHAAALGLRSISMLLPQRDAPYVEANLAVSRAHGAEIHEVASEPGVAAATLAQLVKHRFRRGAWPYVIAPGGSSPLGTLGFVAGGLELLEQVAASGARPPDRMYVALGSGGTAVGLGIAMALAKAPTRVIAVRVTELRHVSEQKTRALWMRTCELLRAHDPDVPTVAYSTGHLEIRHEQFGEGYAAPTAAGAEAAALMKEHARTHLDVTYTAKALACLIADARAGALADSSVVFWNTFAGAKKNPFGDSRPKGFSRRPVDAW